MYSSLYHPNSWSVYTEHDCATSIKNCERSFSLLQTKRVMYIYDRVQGDEAESSLVFGALANRHNGNHSGVVQHFQRLGRVCGELAQWWREKGEPLDPLSIMTLHVNSTNIDRRFIMMLCECV